MKLPEVDSPDGSPYIVAIKNFNLVSDFTTTNKPIKFTSITISPTLLSQVGTYDLVLKARSLNPPFLSDTTAFKILIVY